MKQKFKPNSNTVLIAIILLMALVANAINTLITSSTSEVAAVQSYRQATLPLNILDFIKFSLIVLMGWIIFSNTKRIVKSRNWNERYYNSIKRVGWLSVLVVLLDAVSFVVKEDYIAQGKDLAELTTDATIYADVISHALFSSPIVWFLIACIFLIADVLNHANNPEQVN